MDFKKEATHCRGRRTSLLRVLLIGGDGIARLGLLSVVLASRVPARRALLRGGRCGRFSIARGLDTTSSQTE